MNTAGRLRGMTVNLSSNSPIKYVLEDGAVLDIVETQVVPDIVVTDEGTKRVGPDTLVVCLRVRAKPEQVNGTHENVVPVAKVVKIPRTGSGW
jgi:hypothetical protein